MPFILLVIGLALVLFEFFSSGGLFAIVGCAAVVASVIWTGYATMAALPTIVFALVAIGATLAIYRFGNSYIVPRMQIDEDSQAPLDEELINERAQCITDLSPSGKVKIAQGIYPAIAKSGYIKKGEAVKVIEVKMNHLIVH